MRDVLDSDGPDYDPEAYLAAAELSRKAAYERGEGRRAEVLVAPADARCGREFGLAGRVLRCVLGDGHTGGCYFRSLS